MTTSSTGRSGPIACSLGPAEQHERFRRWKAVLSAAVRRRNSPGEITIEFDHGSVDVDEIATLARAEAECCPYLVLTLRFAPTPTLIIEGPPEATDAMGELLSESA